MNDYTLPFNEEKIRGIEKTFKTPFYLYDEKGIVQCVEKIKKAFSWNKGFKEYFAVKATPNPAILRILLCQSLQRMVLKNMASAICLHRSWQFAASVSIRS